MIALLVALLVAMLFATGTYMVLRREPIKLILGLNLIAYGVNVLLFSSSTLQRGRPPIVEDKAAFAGDISQFVDPVPQALILTAIVISFGITAFLVVLVNQRNMLVDKYAADPNSIETTLEATVVGQANAVAVVANDPFAPTGVYLSGLDADPDDFEWLEDTYTLPPRQGKRNAPSEPAPSA